MKQTGSSFKVKKVHSLQWVFDSFEDRPDFIQKKMFGCQTAYFGHRLMLVLADKEEPWNGILIPTEREFHLSLQKSFPELLPYPILGKWLYLSQGVANFEEIAFKIMDAILSKDPRIGVEPKPKKIRKPKKRTRSN